MKMSVDDDGVMQAKAAMTSMKANVALKRPASAKALPALKRPASAKASPSDGIDLKHIPKIVVAKRDFKITSCKNLASKYYCRARSSAENASYNEDDAKTYARFVHKSVFDQWESLGGP